MRSGPGGGDLEKEAGTRTVSVLYRTTTAEAQYVLMTEMGSRRMVATGC